MFLTRWLLPRPKARPVSRLMLEELEERSLLSYFGNSLFPADNPWNQKITNAPVAANSATLVSSIGSTSPVHPDFGAALYNGAGIGFPINVVTGTQPRVNVVLDAFADESDPLAIPLPAMAALEGDPLPSAQNTGDRHVLVYDKDTNVAYETFNTHRPSETADGQWHADSEAVWDFKTNSFRTPTFTSADAAGLPILPGLVRPDEVLDQGRIDHAIRFTVPRSSNAFVYPASHEAGSSNAAYPRMGERFRLKASFDISSYSPANRVILQALKDYGMIVADNGAPWYLSGEFSSRWNDTDLDNLKRLHGSDFEAVDLTPVVTGLSAPSGPAAGNFTLTVTGLNFAGAAGRLQVFFGTTPATGVTVVSDTQVTITVPAHAAGTVDVTVRTPYGASAVTTADLFTYGQVLPQPGALQFSAARFVVNENAGQVTITVTRTNGSDGAVSVAYATANGLATAGADYTATAGTLNFAAGQTSQTFVVTLLDDSSVEGNETVLLTLSNPTGGAVLGNPARAVLTLRDNDGTHNQRFVAQTYLDVLRRPVDPSGLANWTASLDRGNSRSDVALAITRSPEYRTLLVQDVYQTLLGRAAEPAGLANWVRFLGDGGTGEELAALVLGSAEFFTRSGGSNAGFLQGLYRAVLNRTPDADGARSWGQALSNGQARQDVALAIERSAEARQIQVAQLYDRYLKRPVDASGLSAFATALQRGWRQEEVLAALVGSEEYFGQV